jgi:hypothetical protein
MLVAWSECSPQSSDGTGRSEAGLVPEKDQAGNPAVGTDGGTET